MKIKVNLSKETVSIKGLTPLEFAVIETFMNHTRLGQEAYDGGASGAAFSFAEAIEGAAADLEALNVPEVSLVAVPNEYIQDLTVLIDSPTLEVYAD